MARVVAAVALVLSLVAYAPPARAQSADRVTVFAAVDSFAYDPHSSLITMTGVVQGDASASEKLFYYRGLDQNDVEALLRLQSCERMALLAMAKPGQYQFQITVPVTYAYVTCKLTRVNP